MALGRVLARTTIGVLFAGHGAQKLFGWFDGHGIEGTGQFMEAVGLRPGKVHATAAGATEFGAGIALALGALTPLPNAALVATMLTAIRTVHAKNGPWAANQGWEYNAVLIGALLVLAEESAADGERSGHGALVALGLGVAGAAAAKLAADAAPAPEESAPADAEQAAPADAEQAAPTDGDTPAA